MRVGTVYFLPAIAYYVSTFLIRLRFSTHGARVRVFSRGSMTYNFCVRSRRSCAVAQFFADKPWKLMGGRAPSSHIFSTYFVRGPQYEELFCIRYFIAARLNSSCALGTRVLSLDLYEVLLSVAAVNENLEHFSAFLPSMK